jgi:hypothetical protein
MYVIFHISHVYTDRELPWTSNFCYFIHTLVSSWHIFRKLALLSRHFVAASYTLLNSRYRSGSTSPSTKFLFYASCTYKDQRTTHDLTNLQDIRNSTVKNKYARLRMCLFTRNAIYNFMKGLHMCSWTHEHTSLHIEKGEIMFATFC